MKAPGPLLLNSADKLDVLRQIDQFRKWISLDDQRRCLQCGEIITGRQIEIRGGTRGDGPLRGNCPTENCSAVPLDWALVGDSSFAPVFER